MELSRNPMNAVPEKRYYTSMKVLAPRAAMIVAILVAVPAFLAFSGEDIDGVMIAAFGVMIALSMLVFFGLGRSAWLGMNEQGMVYRGPGMKIATTWDNVEAIETRLITGEGEVEGLALRDSGLDVNVVLKAGSWFSWRATMSLRDYEYFLPISNLQTKDWRETEFGRELRRHAPRLFETR